MASLPQSGTGPAATATVGPAARQRVGGCSSFGSVLLSFDWLQPDPSRNLHGLVSERFAAGARAPWGYRVYERDVASRFRGPWRTYLGSVSATRAVLDVRYHR